MKFSFTPPENREFDVAGFGLNAVDHLVTIPRFPSFNTKVRLTDHRQMSGGQVSSAMVGARRLGLRASYIGKVGYDNEGRMLIESLQKEGVDCSCVMIAMGAKTQGAMIIIEQFSGERTILWYHDDDTRIAPEELKREMIARALKKRAPAGTRIVFAEPETAEDKLFRIFKTKREEVAPDGKTTAFLTWRVMADKVAFDFISSASTLKKAEEQVAPFMVAGMMVAVRNK